MTVFAHKITRNVEVEDDGKIYNITIKKLNARQLNSAATAKQLAIADQMRGFGGEVFDVIRNAPASPAAKKESLDPREQHYAQYDRDTVVAMTITNWDFPDMPPLEENRTLLDLPTAEKVFRAAIDLSDPYVEQPGGIEKKDAGAPSAS